MNASVVILKQARFRDLYALWNDSFYEWPENSGSTSLSPSSISSLALPDWQRWMVVSGLMPVILGLYLAIIMMCYYLLCRKDGRQWWSTDVETGNATSPTASIVASPPPSYAIFVRSGDSQIRPPPYKALFPGAVVNASFESVDFDQLPQVFESTTTAKATLSPATNDNKVVTTPDTTSTSTGSSNFEEGQDICGAASNSRLSFLRLGSQDTLVSKDELACHEESDLFKRILRRGNSF